MKTPRTLLTAGAITAFSFSLAFGAEEQTREVGATEREVHTRTEIEQREAGTSLDQDRELVDEQREFGAPPESRADATDAEEMKQARKASDIKGSHVMSSDGERIGTVDDLAIDLESGEVSYIIVSAGGFLGIGGNLHPVPPQAAEVTMSDDKIEVVLNVTEQQWENAPTVERDEIAQLGEEEQGRSIYQHFEQDYEQRQQGQQLFGTPGTRDHQSREVESLNGSIDQEEEVTPRQSDDQTSVETDVESESQAQASAGQPGLAAEQDAGLQQEQRQFGAPARDSSDEDIRVEIDDSDQTEIRTTQRESVKTADEQEGKLTLADDLKGKEVTNDQQQTLGKIDDLLVDLSDGSISFVLLQPDTDFWESADETYVIAPQEFQMSGEDRITLNITQQDLEGAQTLDDSNIRQHAQQQQTTGSQPGRQVQVYRYQEDSQSSGIFGGRDRETSERREDSTLSPAERVEEQDRQKQEY